MNFFTRFEYLLSLIDFWFSSYLIPNPPPKSIYSNLKGIEAGIPTLKSFECHVDDLNHLDNGRPIKCPITINISEGEEIIAKHKGRVAGILFKDGFLLKVKRKLNT